jgi:hypothetical protein
MKRLLATMLLGATVFVYDYPGQPLTFSDREYPGAPPTEVRELQPLETYPRLTPADQRDKAPAPACDAHFEEC